MKFLQEEVSDSLGFTRIWSEITPSSQLGVLARKRSTPFLKGEEDELKKELDNLELVYNKLTNKKEINKLKDDLSELKDIRGTISRTKSKENVLDDVELFEIKNLLLQSKKLIKRIDNLQLNNLFDKKLKNFPELIELLSIGQENEESFYLADEYSKELKEIRRKKKKFDKEILQLKKELTSEIEKLIKRPIPIDEEINISKSDEELITKLKQNSSVNLIRENFASVTFKLKPNQHILKFEEKKKELKREEEVCKQKIRIKLTRKIGNYSSELLKNLRQIGYLDFLIAKAEFAEEIKGVRPQIISENQIEIVKGRHLLVERELNKENLDFTPIDITVSAGSTLITGPNMGGKTVSLKLLGLLVIMAQYGMFVPAAAFRFSLRNFVYFSLTSDTVESGLSTFGTEINNLREVVAKAGQVGLILIDEVAHGTNPKEGYAIAAAIMSKLDKMNSISVFTSHFERLAVNLEIVHFQVKGLEEDKLNKFKDLINKQGLKLLNKCMNYSLERVSPGQKIPHDALRIAKLLGFDEEVLTSAEAILNKEFGSKGEE